LDANFKLKKVLPDEIVEASSAGIRLKTGKLIPIHYHPREGGRVLIKIVDEVAIALNKEPRWLRERVFRSKS